jgi:hypothetical protein
MMDNRSQPDNHRNINNRERISPHSSSNDYYQENQNNGGPNIKSDSPSRKRRRLQRMPSQSPPTIWENNNNNNNNNNINNNQSMQIQNQNQPNPNVGYHHNPNINMNMNNRRLTTRQYHNSNQQHSPPIRRQRYRDQQQQSQPRPWDMNATPIFQPSPPHHTHHHPQQHSLMVEMNQVPVSLPLGHEQIWTYPAPHISICKLFYFNIFFIFNISNIQLQLLPICRLVKFKTSTRHHLLKPAILMDITLCNRK